MHFTITGDGFTRTARDMMLSDLPGTAWRLVTEGLHGGNGIPTKLAQDLLDGKRRLVGDESSMEFVPDKGSKKYKHELAYIYAGRIRVDGRWWRPKAKVVLFGPMDQAYVDEHGSAFGGRAAFYAGPGERLFCVAERVSKNRPAKYVIFEPTGERPHWWPPLQSPADALADFLAAGCRLEELSHPLPEREDPVHFDSDDDIGAPDEKKDTEAERERAFEAQIQDIKQRVLEQAAGDLIEIRSRDDKVVAAVPRAPFVNWALHRTQFRHLAPAWKTVSPSGLKMLGDDPYHTDWWIGAGIPLDDYQFGGGDDSVGVAAWHTAYQIQKQHGDFECAVIVGGARADGRVGEDIAVMPDLHPDRLDQLLSAKACITQAGGQLAHLAQVAMERSIPIVLVPDALARYPEGTRVTVYPNEGRVVIRDFQHEQLRGAFGEEVT